MVRVGPIKTFINRGTLTDPKWEFLFSSSPAEYRKLFMSELLHWITENRELRKQVQTLKDNVEAAKEQVQTAKDLYEHMKNTKDQALGELQILRGQLSQKFEVAVSPDKQRVEELEKDVEHWKRISSIQDGTIHVLKEWVKNLKDRQRNRPIQAPDSSPEKPSFEGTRKGEEIHGVVRKLIKFVEENLPGGKGGDPITVENVMDRLKEIFAKLHEDYRIIMQTHLGGATREEYKRVCNELEEVRKERDRNCRERLKLMEEKTNNPELKMVSEARDQYLAALLSVLNGVEGVIDHITKTFIEPMHVPTIFDVDCIRGSLKNISDTIDARRAKQELSNLRQIAKAHRES